MPIELNAYDGVFLTGTNSTVLWKRNAEQNFEFDTFLPNLNYITGRTFSQVSEIVLSNSKKDLMRNKFINSMNSLFTAGTTTYVFFEDIEIDDLFVNIKLERTFDVLNTLNIYNKVDGELTKRESPIGVVFGKLEAIQKLSDANGNKLRIPLRNVPIGVFVPSDDYPDPNTMDDDGNRLRLNYKTFPVTKSEQYFNPESFDIDNKFLIDIPLNGISPHPTFQNVVYTNQNGEFILHDVEIGGQILFFEVDLLKQGLTKDEVALNFFPYPPSFENVSIDTIPHYFYRAIPIDVVPSWGVSFQTGYTEVDVAVNLDLRKWTTYIIPPVTYNNFPIDSAEYQEISRAPLTVKIRDMSRFNALNAVSTDINLKSETYPSKQIQMVEIENIIDKNADQQWEWANEFSQIKDKALFYTYGYHAIKLPANIYDDENYKTDLSGNPKINEYSQGVWLCGYQLKVYLTAENTYYRTTGMEVGYHQVSPNPWFDRDHFHCCLNDNINAYSNSTIDNGFGVMGVGIGTFPYEKVWSKNYPTKYSIPKKPLIANFTNPYTGRTYIETPVWKDGDLILGNSYEVANGFGLGWNDNVIQYTDFATDVIGAAGNADMYKYEPVGNDIAGCYVNGYTPDFDWAGLGATSNVINAEKYQRTEAGYGYFLYPSSLPRIITYPWYYDGLHINETDYVLHNGSNTTHDDAVNLGYNNISAWAHHYHSFSVLNKGKSIAMDLSNKSLPDDFPIINDRLNIYRIIDGRHRLPYTTKQKSISTYARLHFGGYANRFFSLTVTNLGEGNASLKNTLNYGGVPIKLFNPNMPVETHYFGSSFVLKPNGYFSVFYGDNTTGIELTMAFTAMDFPGNSNYSDIDNQYTKTKYLIGITASEPLDSTMYTLGGHIEIPWNVQALQSNAILNWMVVSDTEGGDNGRLYAGVAAGTGCQGGDCKISTISIIQYTDTPDHPLNNSPYYIND